ncbi:hypothetical protein [Tabrizicola sp. BL-A-41-H6]|uniref:hypothetical protein n=1 Tax=Tabrizicola sp. BL-A-41-H6 TaxID=3421107 RepID=UPI003D67C26D
MAAAVVLTLGAFLVWVFEPPAPGAVPIGAIITLWAELHSGVQVARDRIIGAIGGGFLRSWQRRRRVWPGYHRRCFRG